MWIILGKVLYKLEFDINNLRGNKMSIQPLQLYSLSSTKKDVVTTKESAVTSCTLIYRKYPNFK